MVRCESRAVPPLFLDKPRAANLVGVRGYLAGVWRADPSGRARHPAAQLQPLAPVRGLRPGRGGARRGLHARRRHQIGAAQRARAARRMEAAHRHRSAPPAAGPTRRGAPGAPDPRANGRGPEDRAGPAHWRGGPGHAYPRRNRAHPPAGACLPRRQQRRRRAGLHAAATVAGGRVFRLPGKRRGRGVREHVRGVAADQPDVAAPAVPGAGTGRDGFHLARSLPGLCVHACESAAARGAGRPRWLAFLYS